MSYLLDVLTEEFGDFGISAQKDDVEYLRKQRDAIHREFPILSANKNALSGEDWEHYVNNIGYAKKLFWDEVQGLYTDPFAKTSHTWYFDETPVLKHFDLLLSHYELQQVSHKEKIVMPPYISTVPMSAVTFVKVKNTNLHHVHFHPSEFNSDNPAHTVYDRMNYTEQVPIIDSMEMHFGKPVFEEEFKDFAVKLREHVFSSIKNNAYIDIR